MKSFATRFRRQTLGLAEREPSPDFVQRVMAAIGQEPPVRKGSHWGVALAAAAGIAVLVSVYLAGTFASGGGQEVVQARRWLLECQGGDGLWHAEAFGGDGHYTPALTALALVALGDEAGAREAVAKGVTALAASMPVRYDAQSEAYNLTLGAYALAVLSRSGGHPEARKVLSTALARLKGHQTAAGGWSYDGSDGNTALTAWNARILALAEGGDSLPVKRALRWLKRAKTGSGAFSYSARDGHTSPTLDALAAAAFRAAGVAVEVPDRLQSSGSASYYEQFAVALARPSEAVAKGLRKSVEGRYRGNGTFGADDTWSPVGGQLYNNALAVLTLASVAP